MPLTRSCRLIYLLITTLLLTGCGKPEGQTLLEDYLYRLGNSAGIEIDTNLDKLPPVAAYPPRRERLAKTTELREGLLDTLNLAHCNLLPLIAERNSSLGRVMPVSQQLIYELRFYAAINHCRTTTAVREDPELKEQVEQIFSIKRQNLPAVFWNAIYNSPEMEANFALGEPPLAPEDSGILGPSLKALQHFSRLLNLSRDPGFQSAPESLISLEKDYEALYRNRFGAHWLSSIRLMTETLERAADALELRLEGKKLCPQRSPTQQARILHNIFRNYYATGVQRYMSQIDRNGRLWLNTHETLINTLPDSSNLAHYQAQVLSIGGALWQRYIAARDRHTLRWQQQLQQCNLMPGQS